MKKARFTFDTVYWTIRLIDGNFELATMRSAPVDR